MTIPLSELERLANVHYQIEAVIRQLPGEIDMNFHLRSADNQEYVLKLSNPNAEGDWLGFQLQLSMHLNEADLELELPSVVSMVNGKLYELVDTSMGQYVLRLYRWVPGRLLRDAKPRTASLLYSWGAVCGRISNALVDFDHPGAHYHQNWDPINGLAARTYRQYLKPDQQELADYWWDYFERIVEPQMDYLRKSINYADAHEDNLLIDENYEQPQITGLIDTGDAVYGPTISELAIAAAYGGMYQDDPVAAICIMIKGYHASFELEEREIELMLGLIAARLLTTVTSAAKGRELQPTNDYLSVHEAPAWHLLTQLKSHSINYCHYAFRAACGWEPCPSAPTFKKWLVTNADLLSAAVDLNEDKVVPFDLGLVSAALGSYQDYVDLAVFERKTNRYLEDQGGTAGYGGYLEIRPFYTTDAYQQMGLNGVRWRTMHLGLDIWKAAETAVFAVYTGTVYSLQNNASDRDYGPTIILRHEAEKGLIFFSLYGHLSAHSLAGLEIGQTIQTGQQIATFGASDENGGWPPHLHFQLILDMLDHWGDFPGVAFPEERAIWESICPDPQWVFSDLKPLAPSNLETAELLAQRKLKLGRSLSLSYEQPLTMVRGWGSYLLDISGRRYLDTVNNVAHVGHEHPRIVAAGQRQMAVLNTNTRYLHPAILAYAEKLLTTFPPELSVVHFTNSGSEANELALRMARTCTGQHDMLAIEVGYHGNTNAVIEVSSYKFDGKGGTGAPPSTHLLPLPDTYRGLHRDQATAGEAYTSYIYDLIDQLAQQGKAPAGFIGESILSCGGQIVLPQAYLSTIYQTVRAVGGICIADEVQTGFGRVGEHFWAFELQEVIPDIVVLGKPIGNGHPLAAVVCTPAVAEGFANGMEYFNTFGGNPVSCAIGLEVLNVIQEEGLQQNALEVGNYLLMALRNLQSQHPIIGDVRGHGLFLGFELVKNAELREPHPTAARYLTNWMRQRGILMSSDGPDHNVIKIKPPIVFGKPQADFLLAELAEVLRHDAMQV